MIYGATLIEGPIPDQDDLEWNSDDLDGDSIPLRHANSDILWWSIIVEGNFFQELYDEMFKWCGENCQYQCALRYEPDYIIGYFRHPDDAVNFKWSWM